MLPFIPNKRYKRTDIQDEYGGTRQGGIAPCSKYPYIFIFSGKTGNQYGYADAWDNENVFSYSGEGQIGDMKFNRGNLALREHLNLGKRVFLFEYVASGIVEFKTELEFFEYGFFEAADREGKIRQAIRFFFKRKGIFLPEAAYQFRNITTVSDVSTAYTHKIPNVTERQGLVTSRVGQGAYRQRIIHRWEYRCAVTGFTKPEILIASHIVPWKESTDTERLDVNNGILLSPVYDALFDRHLISFENNGKIILSDKVESFALQKIGVNGKEEIKKFHDENIYFLERHRKNFHTIHLPP